MKFELGMVVITPAARDLLKAHGVEPLQLLQRHGNADWGDLDAPDRQANDQAIKGRGRLLSRYNLDYDEDIWIITEADRSATTILLPTDY